MTAATSPPPPQAPSAWVARFAPVVPAAGPVLDLACGAGRHGRLFLGRGHPVVLADIDVSAVADLRGHPSVETVEADLEGGPWPFPGRRFAGIVAVNYLHRPLLPRLADALSHGGVLIYDTFAQGQERLGRPRNPAFLLQPAELLAAFADRLQVVAYEHGEVADGVPAIRQRLCAIKGGEPVRLPPA